MAFQPSDLPPIPDPRTLSMKPTAEMTPLDWFIHYHEPTDIEKLPQFVKHLTRALHWYAQATDDKRSENLHDKIADEHATGLDGR